ncbi:UNVERIFIED_CONTAM: hypothetical protein FKN15_024582 [Acipenser sinensis]
MILTGHITRSNDTAVLQLFHRCLTDHGYHGNVSDYREWCNRDSGGRSAGRGPAESGSPTSGEESDYGPSELEGETLGEWDLPQDYFCLFWPIFVLRP